MHSARRPHAVVVVRGAAKRIGKSGVHLPQGGQKSFSKAPTCCCYCCLIVSGNIYFIFLIITRWGKKNAIKKINKIHLAAGMVVASLSGTANALPSAVVFAGERAPSRGATTRSGRQ
jgi:hypothetical protein